MAEQKRPGTLAEALAAFQKEHHAAGKDGKANYGFYTTLAGGLNAVQPATHLGLCHTQTFETIITEHGTVVTVLVTTLKHVSGEEIFSRLPFPELVPNRGNIMQALGSAITYARRYSLLAIYGLAGDDDDAEGSAPREDLPKDKKWLDPKHTRGKGPSNPPATKTIKPKIEFLTEARRERIAKALRNSAQKETILNDFKKQCGIKAEQITPSHIQTPKHGDVLESLLKLPPLQKQNASES